ncbi:hypothetical protein [Hymenobacter convexus]|uniref:hypothetical protein n=1 Tax=Hymenobacter sp. CA1UV-4 TaxID=3063782 RepID=UPI0027128294|nr:hypothetical protein [Hymenobacter sp. CA1UV-4]MDO7852642.1 hypothetical protein [Hymenobacter sp. CA1UV-4]
MNKTGQRLGGIVLFAGLCTAGWLYRTTQLQQEKVLREISGIETVLTVNNRQAARQARGVVGYIAKEVCRNQNQTRDLAVLHQSQQILARTQTLSDTLRALGRQRYDQSQTIVTPELEHYLDRYTEFIRAYVPSTHTLTREFPGAPDPGWLNRVYFQHMPPAARRATLTKLEAMARRSASAALSQEAQKIGSCCWCFSRISAQAVAASETVAPGSEYQARLFLGEAIPLNPSTMEFTANSRRLPVDLRQALAQVAIPVPPAAPGQPDTVRARWHGTIRARICPTDTVFEVDVPYIIVKPQR